MSQGDKGHSLFTTLAFLKSPLITRLGDKPAFDGEELVIVTSPLFPHKLAKGYSNPAGMVVKSINGKPVRNLKHLVELLRDTRDEFVAVDFDMIGAESMVFPRTEVLAATDEI